MANAYNTLTGMVAPIAEHTFEDIADDPNADDIARISPNGLMITTGTTDTTYSPDDPVIRAHMALFLTRLYEKVAGSEAPAADTEFTDIAERNAEQQAAIGQLFGLGVTTGTTPTTYSPSDNVTREQMASFVARMYRVLDALPQAPGAPAALTATPLGTAGTALGITWTAPDSGTSDITGYVVQWGTNYNNQQTTTDTTATFHGLTKGTAYNVRVAAVSDDGQGDWATTTGTPGTTAGPVVGLRAEPGASPGTINVMWSKPADDGGTPLTGYTIQWAQGNSAQQSTQVNNPGATSHTLSGLNSAALYYVWVRATNGAGAGDVLDPATATPTGNVASGIVKINPPGGPDAGGRFATASWPTVTPAPGQLMYSYTIQRSCGAQLWPDEIIPNADARIREQAAVINFANQVLGGDGIGTTSTVEVLLGGAADAGTLINGVECTFRVRANTYVPTDDNNTFDVATETLIPGKWVEGKATPTIVTAPGVAVTGTPTAAPAAVGAIPGNRVVQVNWTLVPATDQGAAGPITGYRVTLSSPTSVPVASVSVGATTESLTFTGLTNGWAYIAVVSAVNPKGAGSPGIADAVTAVGAPGAPTNVSITQGAIRGTTLNVAWNPPAANSVATVTGYALEQRTSATPFAPATAWAASSVQPAGATPLATVTGLTPGTSYDYRVRATGTRPDPATPGSTVPASGPWSAAASGTATNVPLAALSANILVVENAGSLTLAWTPADGNGSEVTSYSLSYRRSPNTGYNPWRSAGSVAGSLLPTKTITGLANAQQYQIVIYTHNAQGRSLTSAGAFGTPQAGNAGLAAPTVKTVVVPVVNDDGTVGAPRIDVTWSAVSRATSYTVEYMLVLDGEGANPGNPVTGPWTNVVPLPRTTSAVIPGLAPNATYVVRVQAATPLGRYGFSAATKAAVPPSTAPTEVDVVQIAGTTTLRVNWLSLNATNAANQGVTGYKVSWAPTNSQVTGNRGSATVTAPAIAGNGMPMSYDITGLTAIGQAIRVTVQAVNDIGAGAFGTDTYLGPAPTG